MGPIDQLPFDDEDARVAGAIRAELERAGKPIGAYDLLIAGQALRHKLKLITANVSEFKRIKGLHWEDWGEGFLRSSIMTTSGGQLKRTGRSAQPAPAVV